MKAIINGRFNPECVTFLRPTSTSMLQLHLVFPDGNKNTLDTGDADSVAESLREWLRCHLESELGKSIPNMPKQPEPTVYGIAGWATGIVSGQLHRECGGIVEEWRDNRWFSSGGDKGWFLKHTAPLTTEQVEKLFGRAALGLPVDTKADSEDTAMWWYKERGLKYLHRNHGAARQCWDEQARRWVKCHSNECAKENCTPATRESIIERLGEGPLK